MGRKGLLLVLLILVGVGAGGYLYWDQVRPFAAPALEMVGMQVEQAPSQDQTQQEEQGSEDGDDEEDKPPLPSVDELHRSVLESNYQNLRQILGLGSAEPEAFHEWRNNLVGGSGTVRWDLGWDTGVLQTPVTDWQGSLAVDRRSPSDWQLDLTVERPEQFPLTQIQLRRTGDSVSLKLPELDAVYELPKAASQWMRDWLNRWIEYPELTTDQLTRETIDEQGGLQLTYEDPGYSLSEPGSYEYVVTTDTEAPHTLRSVEKVDVDGNSQTYEFRYEPDSNQLQSIRWSGPLLDEFPVIPLRSAFPAALASDDAQPPLDEEDPLADLWMDGQYELTFERSENQTQAVLLQTPRRQYRLEIQRQDGTAQGLRWLDESDSDVFSLTWNRGENQLQGFELQTEASALPEGMVSVADVRWHQDTAAVQPFDQELDRLNESEFLRHVAGRGISAFSELAQAEAPELSERIDWFLGSFSNLVGNQPDNDYQQLLENNEELETAFPEAVHGERLRTIREQLGLRLPLDNEEIVLELIKADEMLRPINPEEREFVLDVVSGLSEELQRKARITGPEGSGETIVYNPQANYPSAKGPEGFRPARKSYKQGQYRQARESLEKLLGEFPRSVNINYTLGMIHFEQAEFDSSYHYFNRARHLDHDPQLRAWAQHFFRRVDKQLDQQPPRPQALSELEPIPASDTEAESGSDTVPEGPSPTTQGDTMPSGDTGSVQGAEADGSGDTAPEGLPTFEAEGEHPPGQGEYLPNVKISLRLDGKPLRQSLRRLGSMANREVGFTSSVPNSEVQLLIEDQPMDAVFRHLLEEYDLTVLREDERSLLVGSPEESSR